MVSDNTKDQCVEYTSKKISRTPDLGYFADFSRIFVNMY